MGPASSAALAEPLGDVGSESSPSTATSTRCRDSSARQATRSAPESPSKRSGRGEEQRRRVPQLRSEMGEHSQRVGVCPLKVVDDKRTRAPHALQPPHERAAPRPRTDPTQSPRRRRPDRPFTSGQNGGTAASWGHRAPHTTEVPCRSRTPVSSSTTAVLPIPDGPMTVTTPPRRSPSRAAAVCSVASSSSSPEQRRRQRRRLRSRSGDCSSIRRSRALRSLPT